MCNSAIELHIYTTQTYTDTQFDQNYKKTNMKQIEIHHEIKAIIGLGNPGEKYYYTHHNIGFRVLDQLAQNHGTTWQEKKVIEISTIVKNNKNILLIKPQTFMNNSGAIIPALTKQGIKPENILVVHDELEKPFGALSIKFDGSHRGHNGLRSIITACGPHFYRLRFGIGRPEQKEDVPDYVLKKFSQPALEVEHCIDQAVKMIEEIWASDPNKSRL